MIGTGDRFRQVRMGALALALIMLPWSEFLLSNAQFLLVGCWLWEGIARRDLPGRFKRGFATPESAVFLSFFGLHVVGLLWTSDLKWGLDLCRILLPVLVFGVILASSPRLTRREFRAILLLGAWSTLASTMVCLALRYQVIGQGGYRELSIFISHIRLALLLCFSAAVFVFFFPDRWWPRLAHSLGIAWCVFFLDRLSSLLGLVILALMAVYALWHWSRHMRTRGRWALRTSLLFLPLIAVGYVHWCVRAYYRADTSDLSHLDERSAGGEVYYHDLRTPQHENGHYVWIHVADKELERAWNRRSGRGFKGEDAKGQPLRSTLVRYLASMGQRKDSVGMLALSDADVRRVEEGVPSVVAGRRDPIRARIDQVLYELEDYRASGDASGYSVAMRYEFLRAGWAIARAHWINGVGTGDTPAAFSEEYARSNNPLLERWRLRAHNEYLTLWISFGVFGLLWSLFSWIWPAARLGAFGRPLFSCWLVTFLISCLSEDTIETQAGATFFALYYTVLVFAAPSEVTLRADRARVAERSS